MENLSLESSSFSEFFKTEPENSNVSSVEDVKVFYEISNPENISDSDSEFISFLRCDEVIDYDAEEYLSVIQQKNIENVNSTYTFSLTNKSARNYCDSLLKPNKGFFNPFDSEIETEQVHVQTETETKINIHELGMQDEQNQYQLSVITPCGTLQEFLIVASNTPNCDSTTSQNANDGSQIHVKNEVTVELEAGTDPMEEEYVLSDIPSTLANISSKCASHPPAASKKYLPLKTPTTQPPKSSHPFACKLCARQLKSEPELKIHVTLCGLYHKDRDRFCAPCHRVFSTPPLLERHNFNVHKIVTSRFKDTAAKLVEFKCHICPKTYPSRSLLLIHVESHKKIEEQHRPFKCPMPKCPSSFLRKSALTSHSKTHSNTKPFKCPHPGCDHRFKFKYSIREHFLTHTDAGPRMKCPFPHCNQNFILIKRLNQHVKNCHKGNV